MIGLGSSPVAEVVGKGGWIVPEWSPAIIESLLNQFAIQLVQLEAAGASDTADLQAF